MESFNIQKLYKLQQKKNECKRKSYLPIWNRIIHQIETISLNGQTHLFYKIPTFIFGNPLYKPMECTQCLLEMLNEKGFKTQYVDPYILYIDWTLPNSSSSFSATTTTSVPDMSTTVTTVTNNNNNNNNNNILSYRPSGKLFR
jgi:hypothetical protein